MNPQKIVVLTGAGVSAESGLQTFRDNDGLWNNYAIDEVATPEAWQRNPKLVLDFYNARRKQAAEAAPNAAHQALASLEQGFEVVCITQNVDDLHERAGSQHVIHVHGELAKARSTTDPSVVYPIGANPINLGDTCDLGSQLRPHIVWFGEAVPGLEECAQHICEASKVIVVGTSLAVFPVAGLVEHARPDAEKILVALDVDYQPSGYQYIQQKATVAIPSLVQKWLAQANG